MNTPPITQEEIVLIKRAQAGDERAFNKIFLAYKPFVENLLNSYLNDMDEARDLTNEVFLKVYLKLSKFTRYSSFGGWLRILTKNTAIDFLRTKAITMSIDDSESGIELQDEYSKDEDAVIDDITYRDLISKISTLSPPYRDVCLRFYQDNWTISQISSVMNIPKNTVKSYLHRMRKKFNKKY